MTLGLVRAPEAPTWATTDWSASVRHAYVDGRRMCYVDVGDGDGLPIVLVHGTGGSWQSWLLNILELARDRRVIAVDLPGFGRSDPLDPKADIAAYADAVAALLEELGFERAVAAGHSLGGMVVLHLALRHPELVAGLVLVNSGGVTLGPHRLRLITASLHGVNAILASDGLVRAVIRRPRLRRWLVAGAMHDRDALTPQLAREMLTTFAAPGLTAAIAAGARDDVAGHVDRVACPVLLTWGRHDRLLPLRLAEALQARLRDARLEVVEGAGHCPMIERPDEFNRRVAEFLASCDNVRSHSHGTAAEASPPGPKARNGRASGRTDVEQSTITPTLSGDADRAIDAPTVCAAFQRNVAMHGERPALRTLDGSVDLSWAQLGERVERLARGLAALGVGRGDTVAMLLPNVPECHMVDFAAVHLGAVPFTIYLTSSPEQIRHQLENADARIVITQEAFLPRVQEAAHGLEFVEHVIVVDHGGEARTLADVEAAGTTEFDFEAAWRAVQAEDLVTMIYTSGTTGPPKGAQWVHRTVMAQLRALDAAVPLPTENVISFLPMAHAGGRITVHYMSLAYGACITVCPDLKELPTYLAAVHPDALFAVPRLWEKLQVAIEGMVAGMDGEAGEQARRALDVGLRHVKALDGGNEAGEERADEMAAEHEAALAALRPVIARLGLDRIKAAFVGGAPSAPEVIQFFRAVGVPLLEAYGLTEGGLNVFNRVEEFKTGTAGRPLPGVEFRLADDGEILVRSELNFVGYRKEPEKTAEALDADGWLHTGDIAKVDAEGYVKVVDRKKEIIISAAGKNMSPANIEAAIKGESSLIGQVVCIGDGRRYNTALITLDPEAAPLYAKRLGAETTALEDIAMAPEIHAEIERAVQRGNERLSRVEQIKKFKLLGTAWLPDSDELTPTLKLKRKPIAAKYAAQIEGLYAE